MGKTRGTISKVADLTRVHIDVISHRYNRNTDYGYDLGWLEYGYGDVGRHIKTVTVFEVECPREHAEIHSKYTIRDFYNKDNYLKDKIGEAVEIYLIAKGEYLSRYSKIPYTKDNKSNKLDCIRIEHTKDTTRITYRLQLVGWYREVNKGETRKLNMYQDHIINCKEKMGCVKCKESEEFMVNNGYEDLVDETYMNNVIKLKEIADRQKILDYIERQNIKAEEAEEMQLERDKWQIRGIYRRGVWG